MTVELTEHDPQFCSSEKPTGCADSVLHLTFFPGVHFPLLVGSLCLSSNAAFKSAGRLTNERRCERRGCSYCSTHPVPAHPPHPAVVHRSPPTPSLTVNQSGLLPKSGAQKLLQEEPRRRRVPELLSSFYRHISVHSFINPDWQQTCEELITVVIFYTSLRARDFRP